MLFFLLLLPTVIPGNSANTPEITSQQINDNFYVFFGGNGLGANAGMSIGEDGVLLIDTMNEGTGAMLLKAIREITDQPIKYVLNTHSDADHSGGNAFFASQGAVILSQENARFSAAMGELYFKEELTLFFNQEEIIASHVIAHSYNDVIIYLPASNLIFMGDTFTTSWHPTFSTGGIEGQFEAIDMALLLTDEATQVVPGHGQIADREVLVDFRNDCGRWMHQMAELQSEGIPLDEMVTNESLRSIVNKFNRVGRPDFVPENRLRRFIERTLSSDFVMEFPLPVQRLANYEGTFRMEDGRTVKIQRIKEYLYLFDEGSYMVQLIPLSECRFHLRGWLDDFLLFDVKENGAVAGLTLIIDDEQEEGVRLIH